MTQPEKVTISLHKPNLPVKSDALKFEPISQAHLAALGWAFTDLPTIQAYQRCTGENVAMAFWKYRQWAQENLIGSE